MRAVRNIDLCTKDCLCLYVCPTGATDTENGQIDLEKCLDGCRLCVDACSSHAISLVPNNYPDPPKKDGSTRESLYVIAQNKIKQEYIAKSLYEKSSDNNEKEYLTGIAKSNRLMAEDIMREAGYLLPQSEEVKSLLKNLLEGESNSDFPKDSIEYLLRNL